MKLDMAPILNGETDVLNFDERFVPDDNGMLDVTLKEPVHVTGRVTNMAGCMALTMHAEYSYEALCDRCLAPIQKDCALDLEKNVAAEGTLENEETDEYLIVRDRKLDLDAPLTDSIYLELPERHLCKEDCFGFCPNCGKNLNNGPCGCVTKRVDPRLEVLKQLLDDQNPDHEK